MVNNHKTKKKKKRKEKKRKKEKAEQYCTSEETQKSKKNEEEIGKLPEKEFRIVIAKMIKNLENEMEKCKNQRPRRIKG